MVEDPGSWVWSGCGLTASEPSSQVLVPDLALQWLRDKLPDPISRAMAERRRLNDPLFTLVREGIVNAIVHRDYGIEGARCHVTATADTITVKSPGQPVDPITLEQLQSFTAPMLSRNPTLHYAFARMKLAEERGLGLKSLKDLARQAGLPLPQYCWEDPYLVLTIYRSPAAVFAVLSPEVLESLSEEERASWEFLAGQDSVATPRFAKEMGFGERKAQRILKKFVDAGLLRRVGRGRATRYELARR